MDSAATFISLFRCSDASCSWGQRRVSELIYVCYLGFFSSNVYIANFWGSQGTQLNCVLYIKCRPVNILRLYLFIQLLTYLLNTRIGDYTLLYFWTIYVAFIYYALQQVLKNSRIQKPYSHCSLPKELSKPALILSAHNSRWVYT